MSNCQTIPKIKTTYLYVENYNQYSGDLWLDFVNIDEFNYYSRNGDYNAESYRYTEQYRPSMIYVKEFFLERKIQTGFVLKVSMEELWHLKRIYRDEKSEMFERTPVSKAALLEAEREEEMPATAMMVVHGEAFLQILNSQNTKILEYVPDSIESYLHPELEAKINKEWNGEPCALRYLQPDFKVIVWDVGQGNTNCITDENNLTIFDMGCSKIFSQAQQCSILSLHKEFINKHESISLIISHWDVDHYNLLCSASSDFLEYLCCVFVPSPPLTVTAQQILYKLTSHCGYVKIINSPSRTSTGSQIHLRSLHKGSNFNFYIGERSNDKNKSGFALHVFGNSDSVFLTADHSNSQVWQDMFNNFPNGNNQALNVIVPHHGGYCGGLSIPAVNSPSKAVISVGRSYNHPLQYVINRYINAGFDVQRTDMNRQDIVIPVK